MSDGITPGGMPTCRSHDHWCCEVCFPWSRASGVMLCVGCGVREPFEHRCVDPSCTCEDCREADRLFGSRWD